MPPPFHLQRQLQKCLKYLPSSSSPVRKIFRGLFAIPCKLKLCAPFSFIDSPKDIWSFSATLRNLKLYVHHQERFPRNSSSLAAPHPSPRPTEADEPHQHRHWIDGLVFNGCSHETRTGSPAATPLLLQVTPAAFSPLIQLAIVTTPPAPFPRPPPSPS